MYFLNKNDQQLKILQLTMFKMDLYYMNSKIHSSIDLIKKRYAVHTVYNSCFHNFEVMPLLFFPYFSNKIMCQSCHRIHLPHSVNKLLVCFHSKINKSMTKSSSF